MRNIFAKSIILFFLTFSSCLKENIPLSNVREDYLGDELRMDGLYYQKIDGYICIVQFHYRNGIKLEFSTYGDNIENPTDLASVLTHDRIKSELKRKYNWGIFKIKDNEYLSEQWATPINGNYVSTVTMTGEILSDTSFILTKMVQIQGISKLNSMRYFYPYSPKPDSTNAFIH